MNLRSLSVRDLNHAARAVTSHKIKPSNPNALTVHTPYINTSEFICYMWLWRLQINKQTMSTIRHLPREILGPELINILADNVPEPWCISVPDQQSRNGLIHIIPTTYLSSNGQLLAKQHGYGRSFMQRLRPVAQTILTLLIKDTTVSYQTAQHLCTQPLSRSTFFHIKKRLLNQERYFSWKPSSSN